MRTRGGSENVRKRSIVWRGEGGGGSGDRSRLNLTSDEDDYQWWYSLR